jgi:hypothetical protein
METLWWLTMCPSTRSLGSRRLSGVLAQASDSWQREVSVARVSGALMVCFADLVMNENIAKLHLILGIKQQTLKGEDEGWLVPVSSK